MALLYPTFMYIVNIFILKFSTVFIGFLHNLFWCFYLPRCSFCAFFTKHIVFSPVIPPWIWLFFTEIFFGHFARKPCISSAVCTKNPVQTKPTFSAPHSNRILYSGSPYAPFTLSLSITSAFVSYMCREQFSPFISFASRSTASRAFSATSTRTVVICG